MKKQSLKQYILILRILYQHQLILMIFMVMTTITVLPASFRKYLLEMTPRAEKCPGNILRFVKIYFRFVNSAKYH